MDLLLHLKLRVNHVILLAFAGRGVAFLAVGRRSAGALHMLGIIHLRKREPVAALDAFERLLKLQPNSADVLNNRAMALFDVGRADEALQSFDRALALRPNYREALNNKAGLLYARGRVGESAFGQAARARDGEGEPGSRI